MIDQRIEIVDSLRGLASLAVTWFHLTNTYSEDSLVKLSGHLGWLGVEVFFVISGFIIPYAMFRGRYKLGDHWFSFFLKRIMRLEPPYLAAVLMAIGLWYLSSFTPGFQGVSPDVSLLHFGLHVGYLVDIFDYSWFNPAFWTLAIEFQFYLVISLLFPFIASKKCWVRVLVLILVMSLVSVFPQSFFVFKYLCLFALGIVTFQFHVRQIALFEYILMMSVSLMLIYQLLGTQVAVVGIFTALIISFVRMKPNKLFTYLGLISYSLYLVHIPIGGRVVNLGKRWATSEYELAIVSIVALLVSIFAAHLFYLYVEGPAQKWSSKIRYKR